MKSSSHQMPASFLSEEPAPYEIDQIYRTHGSWLIAFLRRRFGAQEAEDLAQETYLRLTGRNAEIRNPRAYLARVALNAARDQARRCAARPVLTAQESAPPASTSGGQTETFLLKQTILALPPRLRDVFLLSRSSGLTYEEIAHRCGVSVKTVEARMTKALEICKALLT